MFADDFSDRLKVIACIEKPNMVHSEMLEDVVGEKAWSKVRSLLGSKDEDAQLIFWGRRMISKQHLKRLRSVAGLHLPECLMKPGSRSKMVLQF